jgi:hypothetical protein
VRSQLLGDGEPVYLGSTIWRGIAPGQGIDLELGSGVIWQLNELWNVADQSRITHSRKTGG